MTPPHPFTTGLVLAALYAGMFAAAVTIILGRIAGGVIFHCYRQMWRVRNERKCS